MAEVRPDLNRERATASHAPALRAARVEVDKCVEVALEGVDAV
jgi:hypothetical protein